jgi:hypothetical protein
MKASDGCDYMKNTRRTSSVNLHELPDNRDGFTGEGVRAHPLALARGVQEGGGAIFHDKAKKY